MGGGGGAYYGERSTVGSLLHGFSGTLVVLNEDTVLVEDASKVYGWVNRLHVELKSMDAWPHTKGHGRRHGYQSSDPSIAQTARSPPKLTIRDLSRFEFLGQGASRGFIVRSRPGGPSEGLGIRTHIVASRGADPHHLSLHSAFTSLEHGTLVPPVAACSTNISNRKSQAVLISGFLDATKSNPSYPMRSEKITREAHGFILMSDLNRRGDEFVCEILNRSQEICDNNCMLLEDPTAMTSPRGCGNQPSSSSPESRQYAASAHRHLNRPSAQHDASPTKARVD